MAVVASARKKKAKQEKKKKTKNKNKNKNTNKKKKNIKAEASDETLTTGLPAKRMRSTGNSRGATFSTTTP